jgi:hypothetical protein
MCRRQSFCSKSAGDHLEAAELRGVVLAALATATKTVTIQKAKISKTFGKRKADEYLKDDSFWSGEV